MEIPPATEVDSYLQFFKNLTQMGTLSIILVSMGMVSEEKVRGTLIIILTKPVSRSAVVLAKFLAQATLVLSSIGLGAVATYYYTLILFERSAALEFTQATALYLIYSLLIVAITLFFSTLLNNQVVAGGLSLLSVFALSSLPILHRTLGRYSPGALTSLANELVSKNLAFSECAWPLLVSSILIILLLILSCISLKRQEL